MALKYTKDKKAIVIGASTGGPKALAYLISNLPERISLPIFVVQHMPKGFTASFAERLDKESKVMVVEAEDKMPIVKGTVYIAPGDYHMELEDNMIRLNKKAKIFGVRPAVDYLFISAAEAYGRNLLGIILTGMGKDGAAGMLKIKEKGGYNIAQDMESSVVYGMPGHAINQNAVHQVLSLENISTVINYCVRVKE